MTAALVQRCVIEGWLPEQVANGSRGHWSTHQRKLRTAKAMAWAGAKEAHWKPVRTKARLTVTLIFPNDRRRDTDNLYSRCKGIVDGLKDWIVDDSTHWLELVVHARVEPGLKAVILELCGDAP